MKHKLLIKLALSIKTFFLTLFLVHIVAFSSLSTAIAYGPIFSNQSETSAYPSQISELTHVLESNKTATVVDTRVQEAAIQRKQLLLEKAKNDPASFLKLATLANQKSAYPTNVQSHLEEKVTEEGELVVVYLEAKNSFNINYTFISAKNQKTYDLHFAKGTPQLQTGSKVKVTAVKLDSHLVVEAPHVSSSTSFETMNTMGAPTTNDVNIAVLLVNFANDQSTPVSEAELDSILFQPTDSVNAYYKENSFNQVNLMGDIHGWFTLSQTNDFCEIYYYDWATEADDLAIASGVDLSAYTNIIYIFPTPPDCYGTAGTLGGSPARIWAFQYQNDKRTYEHELGHNFGVHHANSLSCGALPINNYLNCTEAEYGDVFDIMGNFWLVSPHHLHFNGPHKAAVNWIPDDKIYTVTTPGTYQVLHEETALPGFQLLKIAKPDTGESYFVSYRQPIGFDWGLGLGVTRGVSIHIWNENPATQTKLIDTTPGTGDFSGFGDATLADGTKFTDPLNGIQIRQLNHNLYFSEVEVIFSTIDTEAPYVTITKPINGAQVPKSKFIKVTAQATDNIQVTKVVFFRNDLPTFTDTTAPYSSNMFTDNNAHQTVTYKAIAHDEAGNTSTSRITVMTP